ncbi:hypothetical protein HU200_066393 [Digitaria exilis]|uniref:Uncharacterized protein n=1 Tax=Digitaria exilis TaxID=1010633 RepID=A0A835DSW9_9POAL|nr:hypothetical protein HU200_066393 [Digitaria exilis]
MAGAPAAAADAVPLLLPLGDAAVVGRGVLGGWRHLAGVGGRAAGRRGVHGGGDACAGAGPGPALPRRHRQPLHRGLHHPLRRQTREEEMAVGAEQPAAFPVRRAGSGRGDWIPGPATAGHEDDVPCHRLRHAEPRPRLHLRHLRLSRVREG